MSDASGNDSAISPAIEAAVPAYVEMLRTATDQLVPQQEIERRAALLAEDHGLDWTASGIARIRAALMLAHEIGGREAAEEMRSNFREMVSKLEAQQEEDSSGADGGGARE